MSANNEILNGDFSEGDKNWRIYLPPGSPASADFSSSTCHLKEGAGANQEVKLAPGTYHFSFEGRSAGNTGSYVAVALELDGLRKQIDVVTGPDFLPFASTFTVEPPSTGQPELFTVELVGTKTGAEYRNVSLVRVA